jgi:hypothetical protein
MLRGVLREFGFGSGRGRRELHEGDDFLATLRSFDRPMTAERTTAKCVFSSAPSFVEVISISQ